jgi:tetratricopeptide (TPR) repeat protein
LAYYKIGDFYMYEQNVEKAIEWFEKGIKADPLYTDNYLNLAMAFHAGGRANEAEKAINRAISIPGLQGKKMLYSYMATYYFQNEKFGDIIRIVEESLKARELSRDLLEILKEMAGLRQNSDSRMPSMADRISDKDKKAALELLGKFPFDGLLHYTNMPVRLYQAPSKIDAMLNADRRLISNWIRKDIQKIIDICKSNGIELIIQNYPVRGSQWTHLSKSYKLANDAIAGIAAENSLPMGDNQAAFTGLGVRQKFYLEAPGGGEHCNSKGYELMARNAYNIILKENILVLK